VALRVPLSPSRGARARVCPPALGCPPGERPALAHRGRPALWRPAPALRAPMAGDGHLRGWGGSEGAAANGSGRAANAMRTAYASRVRARLGKIKPLFTRAPPPASPPSLAPVPLAVPFSRPSPPAARERGRRPGRRPAYPPAQRAGLRHRQTGSNVWDWLHGGCTRLGRWSWDGCHPLPHAEAR
jgi:hypothetical protein